MKVIFSFVLLDRLFKRCKSLKFRVVKRRRQALRENVLLYT